MAQVSSAISVDEVVECVADVLERDPSDVDPDRPLIALGLESFTAVQLRRRLLDDADLDLPLTAFLGDATARTVASGVVFDAVPGDGGTADGPEADPAAVPGAVGAWSFPLTSIQAAYLVGRDPAFPLGGVSTFWFQEFSRVPHGDPMLDVAALEAGWDRLVRRHPMLRVVVGADTRQRVLADPGPARITVEDLRGFAPEEAAEGLAARRSVCSHQLRPTDVWPLHDLSAVLLPDGTTRLLLGVDVLTVDLAGWFRLLREWGAVVADPDVDLPRPAPFEAHVRATATPPSRDLAYWDRRAAALPDGPALPWTAGALTSWGHRFVRETATLPEAAWMRLRDRAAQEGLSPTAVLLAAFALVLHRWGAAVPFALNTTLFDGDPAAAVGDHTTTVLVEIAAVAPCFAELATTVNHRFWTDLEHGGVSGPDVLRRAYAAGTREQPRDGATGRPVPAHPVVFTSGLGLSGDGGSPTAWLGELVGGISQTPQVLLDHIVEDSEGPLRTYWDLVEGALPPGRHAGMRDAHATLLARLADDPSAWRDPTLGADPTMAASPDVAGSLDDDPLLDGPLRAAAGRSSEAPALVEGNGATVSAGEVAERADATALVLAGVGLGPGDLVGVIAEKSAAQVCAVLGVLRAGAGYVPIEPSWPDERVRSVCDQAGITHLLVGVGCTAPEFDGVTSHRLTAIGTLPDPDRSARELRRPTPEDLAYAIFTSGSTGRPKGVAVEHRAARTTLDDLAGRIPLSPADRVLALSAFSFDLSVFDVFSGLGSGAALVLPDPLRARDPGHWLELMATQGVTVWNSAPALLEMLVEYAEVEPDVAGLALAGLRLVILSGDWIPVTLPDRVRALAPRAEILSLGGATEASIWSIHFPIGTVDPAWRSIPYGRALGGQTFHVLDGDGVPCPVGVDGELFIGGAGLARGYVGDPAQTAERFVEHARLGRLYRTGDLGRWRTGGDIEFLGRVDRQVKVRGHRIELGEIESVLDRLAAVRQSVAQTVAGPDGHPRLICHVAATDPQRPPGDDELVAALRTSLPSYMVPARFVHRDAIPVTDNGKVDHAALAREAGARGAPARSAPDAPVAPEPVPDGAPSPAPSLAAAAPAHSESTDATGVADVLDAVDHGLELRLVVAAGRLDPLDALETATRWARSMRRTLSARGTGVAVDVDLPAEGLVGLVVRPGSSPAAPGTSPDAAAPPVALPAPAAPIVSAVDAEMTDPQVERTIARVFSELLEGPVDVAAPFFRLGATSLTLVLAHRRLVAELDPELLVVDLFSRPTVRDLARFVTGRRSPAGPAAPTPDHPSSAPPPTGPVGTGRAASRRAARAAAAELAR